MASSHPSLGRRGYVARLVISALLFAAGADLLSPTLSALSLASFTLTGAGIALFARTLLFGGAREGLLYRKRKTILTAGISTALSLALLALVTLHLPIGPTRAFRDGLASLIGFEPELGWAPRRSPSTVGMHRQAIDHTRPRILFLGDSIVQGHGIAREQVVDRAMEALLPGRQVLNAAVTGYSVDQYYLYLRRIIDDVKPGVVLVGLFTGNDYQVTGREHGWGHSKPLFAVEAGALVRVDRAGKCVDQMAASLLFRVLWSDRARAMNLIHALCKPRELALGELEAVLSRLFVEIEALGAQRGIKTVFALLPERREYAMFGSDFARYGSRHADFARLLRKGGHDFVDFALDVARARNAKAGLYLQDNAHLTPRGHALLAEALVAHLQRRGVIE